MVLKWSQTALLGLAAIAYAVRAVAGPFAPPAGYPDSTAVLYDSALFVGWATSWTNYVPGVAEGGTIGFASHWKNPSNALGQADAMSPVNPVQVVALGGGGMITLLFDEPIANGPGDDFAVFENAVTDGFLELAWVEVSSDGNTFMRLPNISLTTNAIDAYALTNVVDATDLDGLASKYTTGYGTPFDLETIAGSNAQVDVTNIRYVRVHDIVGDGSCTDSVGHVIYDPFPTSGSPGFDLDAVGVINTRLEVVDMAMENGEFDFSWMASTNRLYQVQWSAEIEAENWNDVGGVVTGANQQVSVLDQDMTADRKYYRILKWVNE